MPQCRLCLRRTFATVAEHAPPRRTRIAAACLLSRPPLQLSPLSPLEKAYFAYSRRISRALSAEFNSEWYFRKGSQAEKVFQDAQAQDSPSVDAEAYKNEKDGDLKSLNRRYDRTLYLLLRKKRQGSEKGAWQCPQGSVEDSDASLKDAAVRELFEEVGRDIDLFTPSRVPASVYTYDLPASSSLSSQFDETKLFLMPARILRGQAKITSQGSQERIEEFAWLTKEEVQERVDPDYWQGALKSGQLLAQ